MVDSCEGSKNRGSTCWNELKAEWPARARSPTSPGNFAEMTATIEG